MCGNSEVLWHFGRHLWSERIYTRLEGGWSYGVSEQVLENRGEIPEEPWLPLQSVFTLAAVPAVLHGCVRAGGRCLWQEWSFPLRPGEGKASCSEAFLLLQAIAMVGKRPSLKQALLSWALPPHHRV